MKIFIRQWIYFIDIFVFLVVENECSSKSIRLQCNKCNILLPLPTNQLTLPGIAPNPTKYWLFRVKICREVTGQSIYSLGKVSIEILPGKDPGNRHITWVLAVLLFSEEFQMEPLVPNTISYDSSQKAVLDWICTSQ